MDLSALDQRLLEALAEGLPLAPQPYAVLGDALGISEAEVMLRLAQLQDQGAIRRLGVIVRHHELGYRANAMVVWDAADAEAAEAGRRLADLPFVTLAYRRPRRLPDWPYNLFCMIHGRDRAAVLALIDDATSAARLDGRPRAMLFSRRRFKQRGARYAPVPAVAAE